MPINAVNSLLITVAGDGGFIPFNPNARSWKSRHFNRAKSLACELAHIRLEKIT
jgi:hypothetical protein